MKVFFGIDYSQTKKNVKEVREYNLKVFKVKVEVLKGLDAGEIDPFSVMKKEFLGSPYKTVRVNNFNELHIISSGST